MSTVTILGIIIAILSVALIIAILCLVRLCKELRDLKQELKWNDMSFR